MRAAVILAALAIKSFLWLRTMTPQDAIILRIAAFQRFDVSRNKAILEKLAFGRSHVTQKRQ